jgi:hypothetical protein
MGQTNVHFTQLQLISKGQFLFVESCCTFIFTHLPDTIYTHNNIQWPIYPLHFSAADFVVHTPCLYLNISMIDLAQTKKI